MAGELPLAGTSAAGACDRAVACGDARPSLGDPRPERLADSGGSSLSSIANTGSRVR